MLRDLLDFSDYRYRSHDHLKLCGDTADITTTEKDRQPQIGFRAQPTRGCERRWSHACCCRGPIGMREQFCYCLTRRGHRVFSARTCRWW